MESQEMSFPFPQVAQEADERQKPSFSQEDLPILNEEQLEAVAGGSLLSCLSCASKPKVMADPEGRLERTPSGNRIFYSSRNAQNALDLDNYNRASGQRLGSPRFTIGERTIDGGQTVWVHQPIRRS